MTVPPLPVGRPTAAVALITPHIGGKASAFEPRIVKLLASQLKAMASGERPANLVQAGPFRLFGIMDHPL